MISKISLSLTVLMEWKGMTEVHALCVIAASFPDGHTAVTRGTIEGVIAKTPAGCGGFGYDPIVYVPELGKTTAEISAEEKNKISHRGKALRAMKAILQKEESNNE